MMFPQVCITQKSVFDEFSHFFVAIFSLIFIGHLYRHLLLNSFILNHTSRLSSCKFFSFQVASSNSQLGRIFQFFFSSSSSSLALTFAQTALLGFQPSGPIFFFFFFFFALALALTQTALLGFQPSGLFFFSFFCFLSSLD